MKNDVIAILSKVPIPGLSKTRLSPPFTLKQCAFLSLVFLKDTLNTAAKIKDTDIFVFYAPKIKKRFFKQLLKKAKLKNEEGKSLGDKLVFIFNSLFMKGYENIIVIPADCPDIPKNYLDLAFSTISKDSNTIIIGPSSDGAFYLIGANACNKDTINKHMIDIDWSAGFSLKKLTNKFKKSNIPIYLLPEWHDIDTFPDIINFLKRSGKKKMYTNFLINRFLFNKLPVQKYNRFMVTMGEV